MDKWLKDCSQKEQLNLAVADVKLNFEYMRALSMCVFYDHYE